MPSADQSLSSQAVGADDDDDGDEVSGDDLAPRSGALSCRDLVFLPFKKGLKSV